MSKNFENRFAGLDLVKVFSIVWICLFHLLNLRYGWKLPSFGSGEYWQTFSSSGSVFTAWLKIFINLGVLGVNLFVIVSGFGLAVSANSKTMNYVSFLKKRIFRIFPIYWFILGAILICELVLGFSVNYFDYFLHFLGINTFFSKYVLSISAPFWFIGVIFQLYLLFPLIFRLSKKIHPFLLLILALLIRVFIDPLLVKFFGGGRFFSECILDFVIGILLGNFVSRKSLEFSLVKIFLIFSVFVFSVLYLVFVNLYLKYPLFSPLISQLAALTLFLMLFYCGKFLNEKMALCLKFLSSLSFIVFLTHYYFLTKIFSKIVSKMPFLIESLLFVLLSFVLAFCVERLVEIFRLDR